jgi:mRNA interferase MazF
VAGKLNRGEIWQYTFTAPDKRRPVVIISRQEVIPLLRTVMVAPITSTIHGSPAEVTVGVDEGLKLASAANLDHVQTVDKARLSRFVGRVGANKMRQICLALARATGCD